MVVKLVKPIVRSPAVGGHVSEGTLALWDALARRGWSQGHLARELSALGEPVGSGTINRWLHGTRPMSLTWAGRLHELLGIEMGSWGRRPSKKLVLRPTGTG